MTTTEAFLNALFKSKPAEAHVLIWTLPGRRSAWFTDLAQAVEYADLQDRVGVDVYFGLGLSPKNFGVSKRCAANDVAGITCVWIDVDVKGIGHQKDNLPTEDEAKVLLQSVPLRPSIVVNSGGGFHAYWLLTEPWIFKDAKDRAAAAALTTGWVGYLRSIAEKHGFDVDAVQDLARVFRVAGTRNFKDPDNPRDVRLLSCDPELVYSREQLLALAKTTAAQGKLREAVPVAKVVCGLLLSATASPPFDKFEALKDNEPRFMDSWLHRRKDMQDQSPSSYDLSLASFAVMAGWTDQEIVDLLIAHRRTQKVDLKLREAYYVATIQRARQSEARTQAASVVDEMVLGVHEAVEASPEVRRTTILENLSTLLGIGITRLIRYKSDPPQYRLETTNGCIMLGSVSNLIVHGNLRNAVAATCGKFIAGFKAGEWAQIAQLLLDACVDEDAGAEATDSGTIQGWLHEYLEERVPIENITEAQSTRQPYRQGAHVIIFGGDLRRWLMVTRNERVSAKDIGARLRAFGCEPGILYINGRGRNTSRSIWTLPEGID